MCPPLQSHLSGLQALFTPHPACCLCGQLILESRVRVGGGGAAVHPEGRGACPSCLLRHIPVILLSAVTPQTDITTLQGCGEGRHEACSSCPTSGTSSTTQATQ